MMFENDVLELIKNGHVPAARELQKSKPREESFMTSPSVLKQFEHQNDFGPHDLFDNCGTNWQKYFFNHGGAGTLLPWRLERS